MSRVNVYASMYSRSSGRDVSMGGRRAQDDVSCWLNTDNASGTTGLTVAAEVVGTLRSRDRRRGDNRKSVFSIRLPDDCNPATCTVNINQCSDDLPHVLLPGGVPMQDALAAYMLWAELRARQAVIDNVIAEALPGRDILRRK